MRVWVVKLFDQAGTDHSAALGWFVSFVVWRGDGDGRGERFHMEVRA